MVNYEDKLIMSFEKKNVVMRILFVATTRMMYIVNVLIFSDNNYNITVVLSGHLDLYTRHLNIVMTLINPST